MQILSRKDAEYGLGCLSNLARVAPVLVAKRDRIVVVVMLEEFERLKEWDEQMKSPRKT